MKTTIGVYENHELAVEAAAQLKNSGFPMKEVSIIGVRERLDDDEKITTEHRITTIAASEVGMGALIGSTVGILAGAGIFAIPGVGFLFGAGAIVGALAGLDMGLVGGGIVAALSIGGLKDHHHKQYEEHLKGGRYLLMVKGSLEDAELAMSTLNEHDKHLELNIH